MRADEFLHAADDLPLGSLDQIAGPGGLVIVAPHPDDESLGCGGLIAEARMRGRPVRIVVLSDGTGSHPNSSAYPAARLRRLREDEAIAAGAALSVDQTAIDFLGLPDRSVPGIGRAAEAAADRIAGHADAIEATCLFATWEFDPHGDHRAAHAIARLVLTRLAHVRLRSYPIWGWDLPADMEVGTSPRGHRLDVTAYLPAKQRAISAYRSQMTPLITDDPEGFCLQPEMLRRFARPFEIFLEPR